jgi:hypothetical protein
MNQKPKSLKTQLSNYAAKNNITLPREKPKMLTPRERQSIRLPRQLKGIESASLSLSDRNEEDRIKLVELQNERNEAIFSLARVVLDDIKDLLREYDVSNTEDLSPDNYEAFYKSLESKPYANIVNVKGVAVVKNEFALDQNTIKIGISEEDYGYCNTDLLEVGESKNIGYGRTTRDVYDEDGEPDYRSVDYDYFVNEDGSADSVCTSYNSTYKLVDNRIDSITSYAPGTFNISRTSSSFGSYGGYMINMKRKPESDK